MIWLLRDFDLLVLLLHALGLACEALVLGGAAYVALVALPSRAGEDSVRRCRGVVVWSAAALIGAELGSLAISAAVLVSAGVPPGTAVVSHAAYMEVCASAFAVLLAGAVRKLRPRHSIGFAWAGICASGVLWSTAELSHAASRIDDRAPLILLTLVHHAGTALWIGAMPYLLLSLARERDPETARRSVRGFSRMAMAGAALLIGAGSGLAWFYVGSGSGLYGTAYGAMLLAKIYLLVLLLVLGGANWILQRKMDRDPVAVLAHLRRFAEAEVGLGLTAILAAASLTAQPPAVDTPANRLTPAMLVQRFRPELPTLTSPPVAALAAPTPLRVGLAQSEFTGAVAASDANDRAWSEYNHHWAGLIVLAAGAFALLSSWRGMGWARYWPACFAGLSVFILLRADPECWPLGPRPFWKSFAEPDVLEHRVAALLILGFAGFECGVQSARFRLGWAKWVFPAVCGAGAALLLTHNHGQADANQELLIEISHIAIALLGATAGWARWLELRLPQQARAGRVAGRVWPVALMLAGLVLLDYREA